MTTPTRRRAPAVVGLLAISLIVVGCTSAVPSATPVVGASVAPTASIAPTVGPSAFTTPNARPTAAATPTASSSAAACVLRPQTLALPSDRLTDIEVMGLPGRDVVRFTFGDGSLAPMGPSIGTLGAAVPPFTQAGSGRPIALAGEHALQTVFKGMSIMNDVGQPTFSGEREIRGTDVSRSLRDVVIFDESEGQIGWYVGYEGSSCVMMSREGDSIVLVIDFGAG